jgi:hypothetical protein
MSMLTVWIQNWLDENLQDGKYLSEGLSKRKMKADFFQRF